MINGQLHRTEQKHTTRTKSFLEVIAYEQTDDPLFNIQANIIHMKQIMNSSFYITRRSPVQMANTCNWITVKVEDKGRQNEYYSRFKSPYEFPEKLH